MAFPATPLDVLVELALGEDPGTSPSGWSWTDITDYTLARDSLSITRGRSDRFSTTAPAQMSITLDNTGGRFVARNPLAAYYPLLRRNVPIRITIEGSVRFTGFIDQLPARWDISGNDCYAPITASSILKRIGRQSTPIKSTLRRQLSPDNPNALAVPLAYWPMEDGSLSGTLANELRTGFPMHVATVLAAADPPSGSRPVVQMTNLGFMVGSISGGSHAEGFSAECIMRWPSVESPTGCAAFEVRTTGTAARWQIISDGSPRELKVTYLPYNSTLVALSTGRDPFDGEWHTYSLKALQVGANITVVLRIDDVSVLSTVVNTLTAGKPTSVYVSSASAPSPDETPAIGHLILDSPPSVNTRMSPNLMLGEPGTEAHLRIGNLLALENIPHDAASLLDTTLLMGPQPQAPILDVLRDAEATDGGILSESRDGQMTYLNGRDRYNLSPDLELDYEAGHIAPPWEPTDDDADLLNDVTASRPGGSSVRYVRDEHVALEGRFDGTVSANPELDRSLLDHASWRAHLGTVDEQRYPALSLDFKRNPDLMADWHSCDLGSWITVDNPPGELAPDQIALSIEGYTETVSAHGFAYDVEMHCSPASPWRVGIWDDDVQGKADTAGSVVAAAVNSTTTSVDLATTTGPLWTTADAQYPFDLAVGGERMTVTDIAASVITYGAVGTATHASNASVVPGLPASISAGNLLILFSAIRNSGTGHPDTPAGWTRIPPFDAAENVRLCAKIAGASESAPTVTFTGGALNATTSAQIIRVAGKFYDANNVVLRSASCLNDSAQNITYPGLTVWEDNALILYLGWKQDDWTSVVSPGTEIAEAFSILGSQQGLVWARTIQTARAHIPFGVFTVTGGAAAISRGAVLAIRCDRQTATVTRSTNGVVKAQTAATPVRLWTPMVMGL